MILILHAGCLAGAQGKFASYGCIQEQTKIIKISWLLNLIYTEAIGLGVSIELINELDKDLNNHFHFDEHW